MRGTNVLISGASIAGPALAFWLHRFGARVTVVERAPGLRPGGQAIDIRGVAREVVKLMGLDPQVRAALTATGGMSFVDRRNRTQATLRADQFDGDGPIAEYEILRGDLSKVLFDATKDDVEYVFGDRIAALDEQPDGVHVNFETGAPRVFDVVVGADGLHSGVRAQLFGDEARHLRHLGSYLAFWTADNHLGLENWAVGYGEPGRTAGVRTIHDNVETMVFFGFDSEQLDYDYRDVEAQKALVREHAKGMAWETAHLVAQIDASSDFFFDSCSQVVLESWSRGRVGLLGDAAFCASPVSGQGTSLALVGAYVLAGELATAGGDHAAGLAAYERRMRDWVLLTQQFGRANAKSNQVKSAFALRLRTLVIRLLPYLPGKSLLMSKYRKVTQGFELPVYAPVAGVASD